MRDLFKAWDGAGGKGTEWDYLHALQAVLILNELQKRLQSSGDACCFVEADHSQIVSSF